MALGALFLGGAGEAEITDHRRRSPEKWITHLRLKGPQPLWGQTLSTQRGLPGWRRGQNDKEAPCPYSTEGPACCGKGPRAVGTALEDLGSRSFPQHAGRDTTILHHLCPCQRQAPLHSHDCHGDALEEPGLLCPVQSEHKELGIRQLQGSP